MHIILATVSGLLTSITFPTVFGQVHFPNLGWLAWVSLVPLFWAIHEAGPRRTFGLTFLTAIIYYSISLYWLYNALTRYGHLNPIVSIGVLVLMMIILAAYIALAPMFASWVESKTGVNRFWTIPVFWVVCEFVRNWGPCNGFPWGSLTNSQYAYPLIIQIVDVVGVYGLVYVMVVVNYAVAQMLGVRRREPDARIGIRSSGLGGRITNSLLRYGHRAPISQLLFAGGLLIVVILYGYVRMHQIASKFPDQPSIRVAIIQGNIPQEEKWRPGLEEDALRPYQEYMRRLENSKSDLIIWPEASYPWSVRIDEQTMPHWKMNGRGVVLLGGLSYETGKKTKRLWNSSFLVDEEGAIIDRYHKVHLVPFGEYVPYKKALFFAKKLVAPVGDFAAGEKASPITTGDYNIGPLVCYEDIFPEIARSHVLNGAGLLVNITNDAWYGRSSAAFQHLAISVFRAVETRRWLVRSANTGVSAVIDPLGRVVLETDIFEKGVITTNVGLGGVTSPYVRFGDWFAWMCAMLVVLMLGYAGVRFKIQTSKSKLQNKSQTPTPKSQKQ